MRPLLMLLVLTLLAGVAQAGDARWCKLTLVPVTVLGTKIPRQDVFGGGSMACYDCYIDSKREAAAGAITYYEPKTLDFVKITRQLECVATKKQPTNPNPYAIIVR